MGSCVGLMLLRGKIRDRIRLSRVMCWKFYNGPVAVKLIIKEHKGDYLLEKITNKHFGANEVYSHPFLFSYTLINWFKRLYLIKEFQNMMLNTLRNHFLLIPDKLKKP